MSRHSQTSAPVATARSPSPRERIIAAARSCSIARASGHRVDAIAEAAGTNKMTLYRHFSSKDELVAECLREFAKEAEAKWETLAQVNPGKPREQLRGWLKFMAEHVCATTNAAARSRMPPLSCPTGSIRHVR